MRRSIWEAAKSVLLILLVISMLLLFGAAMPAETVRSTPWLSAVLQPFAPLLGLPAAELTYVAGSRDLPSAAQPLSVSVRNSAGRHTARWDFSELDASYTALSGLLTQAMESAGTFSPVGQAQLTKALSMPSICFDYGFALPPELAAVWLDAAWTQDLPEASLYVLALDGEQVWLYLRGSECRRAATAVAPEEFLSLTEQYEPDGSYFAFESLSHLHDLCLLPGQSPVVELAQMGSLCDNRYVDSLANSLGFNPYDKNRYTDRTGVTHFSETGRSLQISEDGSVLMTSSTQHLQADGRSLKELTESARALLSLTVDPAGSGRLYLSAIRQNGEQTVCEFEYILRGIPVRWSDGPAASVTFQNQNVVRLQARAVRFTFNGQPQYLLPPVQASAVVPKNGTLQLQYHAAAEGLTAGWAQ